jgi:predicted  nucleic acid-binding Zn-ribbon protein
MRFLFILLLVGCGHSDDSMNDLINKVNKSQEDSKRVQVESSNDNKKVITKTVKTIVTLKQEVKELKTELNEVKSKLDSANAIDTGSKFKFKPIGR